MAEYETKDLSIGDAAKYLGIRESALRKLNKEGKGPKRRVDGRQFYFRKEDLDEFRPTLYQDPKPVVRKAPVKKSNGGKGTSKLPKELT